MPNESERVTFPGGTVVNGRSVGHSPGSTIPPDVFTHTAELPRKYTLERELMVMPEGAEYDWSNVGELIEGEVAE